MPGLSASLGLIMAVHNTKWILNIRIQVQFCNIHLDSNIYSYPYPVIIYSHGLENTQLAYLTPGTKAQLTNQ